MTMTDELRAEIVAAVEAANLHWPEQVCDLVIDAAERGEDWRARLAECIRADPYDGPPASLWEVI